MKKSIIGPFWFLLVFGLLWLLVVMGLIHEFRTVARVRHMSLWRLFVTPAIILAEAIVYLIIRKKNKDPRVWSSSGAS